MRRMNAHRKKTFPQWLREKRWAILVLGAAALLFFLVGLLARMEPADQIQAEDYSEYETGRILEILSDTTEPDPSSDGAARGEQLLLVEVTSGQYQGRELEAYNYVSPLYGVPLQEGNGVTLLISTYGDGTVIANVFEYNREPAILIVLALFLVVPRTGYVNRSQGLRDRIAGTLSELPEQMLENMEKRAPAVRPVSTERVNLQALGPQSSQKQPVMYVFAQYEENLYLRGRDYDRYTGTGWESTPDRQESYGGAGGMVELVRLRALTGSFQDLFLPCYPGATVTLIGGKVENGDQLGMYEMIRCASSAAADSPDSRYLELPEETAARAGRILVENDLLEGDPWAIADFVRGSASYDRGTEAMPKNETDFALWFLESADTGYCVHFATGAVVLLRAAGIPARYVTGYLAWTKAEGWATVTADRAHAWAEFYDGERWQILDATPAAPEETEETEPAASEDKTQPTNGPEPEETTQAPTALEPDKTGQEKKPDLTWLVTMGKTMLWAALTAGLVTLQRLTRRFLRRKKAGQGDGSRRGLALWQEAERMAKLLGEKPPEELLAAAQKASFSQHTLTPEELVPFENYLRQCRRKLSRAPWYRRLVYKWIYAVI